MPSSFQLPSTWQKHFTTLFRCSQSNSITLIFPLSQLETSRRVNSKSMTSPIPNLGISWNVITELNMTPENSSTAPRGPVELLGGPVYYTAIRNRTSFKWHMEKLVQNTAFPATLLFSNVILQCYPPSSKLGLAGMELILFTAVQVVPCSKSVTKQHWQHNHVLAISKQTLYSIKGFSLSLSDPLTTQQIHCGWAIGRERTKLGQLTPTDLRDTPHHTMCHAQQ